MVNEEREQLERMRSWESRQTMSDGALDRILTMESSVRDGSLRAEQVSTELTRVR